MGKKKTKKWEDELREIFKEEIKGSEHMFYTLIRLYPTKEIWDEIQERTEQDKINSPLFEEIRMKFSSDDEFEQFIISAIDDSSILSDYLKKEQIVSFHEYLSKQLIRSSGCKKLINSFLDLIKKDSFRKEILKIRQKYNIPLVGRQFSKENLNIAINEFENESAQYELAEKFGFYSILWGSFFIACIFFDDIDIRVLPQFMFDFELCEVTDEKSQHEEKFTKENTGYKTEKELVEYKEMRIERRQNEDNEFPIAIRISPYASERDILDFVKRNFHEISDYQNNYKLNKGHIAIGKSKRKNPKIKERNDLIFNNQHLPRREIMKLLITKFGKDSIIDQGYIGKIISVENKKRKEL